MASKGFAIYGLVSQPQSEADSAKEEWGISYDIIGSPDVSLVKHLADEKIINLVISEKKNYPNGMVQPALLFLRRSDRAVLFSWAVAPDSSEFGFASYRPTPGDVWKAVSSKLEAPVSELPVVEEMPIDGVGKALYRSMCSCFVRDN
ncbi:CPK4 [Symbiodinium sp. CCMP2592]|nr:CPK4 [Symbiodinium sp. CCMP2592]